MEDKDPPKSTVKNDSLFRENENSNDFSYSLASAVSDFKKGIVFYKKKQWKSAYPLIKHAISKFQVEKQAKMTLECNFLLGNILLQLNKYINAIPYFELNQDLSNKLTHSQYWEISTFNLAFSNYKLNNFDKAIQFFSQIDSNKIVYINKVHYYIFLGRSHAKLNNHEEAIESLSKSILLLQNTKNSSSKDQIQLAKVFSDLGQITFSMNLRDVRNAGFQFFQTDIFTNRINQSINYFLNSVELWNKLDDKNHQIEIFQIIANIYGFLQDFELQIQFMKKALNLAEEIHDFKKIISILRYLIQFHKKMGQHQEIIILLQDTLISFNQFVFTDQLIIAEFRFQLGSSLHQIGEYKGALKQLFAALNTYEKSEIPVENELDTLNQIIQIYNTQQDDENQSYYQKKYNLLEKKVQNTPLSQESPIGALEDLWIFTQTGIEIYSYNPKLKLDLALFGGFVSALHSFSKEITKDSLKSFVIGSSKYTIYAEPRHNLHILGRSQLSIPENMVLRILQVINQVFYEEYEKYIVNFTGNVEPYGNFTKYLSEIDFNLL
ncbi:MAG: tetratricopeptide repeat protein [Promethearchaeota archaeon]